MAEKRKNFRYWKWKKLDKSKIVYATLRCRLEKDSQLLANRIALLRQEDSKARKKIQEAHKQTKELLKKKEEHEMTAMKVKF